MNAQDRVFGCFPNAVIRKECVIVQRAPDVFTEENSWVVFAGTEFGAEEIGRGRNETEAWYDAAGLLGNQAA